jgi:hypothetical protein
MSYLVSVSLAGLLWFVTSVSAQPAAQAPSQMQLAPPVASAGSLPNLNGKAFKGRWTKVSSGMGYREIGGDIGVTILAQTQSGEVEGKFFMDGAPSDYGKKCGTYRDLPMKGSFDGKVLQMTGQEEGCPVHTIYYRFVAPNRLEMTSRDGSWRSKLEVVN